MASTDDQPQGSTQASTPAMTAAGMQAELEDRSKYIRTMAKDMAALQGAPAKAAPAKSAAPAEESRTETVSGVTLQKEERPFFERMQSRAERDGEETVALPSFQEASSIVDTEPAAPAPAADADAERAAVLDRLRQKVGESAQMSIQQSPEPSTAQVPPAAPVPQASREWPDIPAPKASFEQPAPIPAPEAPRAEPTPVPVPPPAPIPVSVPVPIPESPRPSSAWSNIPSPAPEFAPLAEPAPARMPQVSKESYREPIEPYVPPRPIAPAPAISSDSLHTYKSDFADRIDSRGASKFSVLAAEQDAKPAAVPALATPKQSPLKAVLAVATGMFVLALAGGGAILAYQAVMTMRDTPIAALTVPSIVFADEYRELSGTGTALMQSLATSANAALLPGNVLVTYLLAPAGSEGGPVIARPLGGASFLRALQVPAPDILLRNITDDSTAGVINAGTQTKAFFALRVDSYERTYAGMLTWEPLLLRDLATLYPLYPADALPLPESEPVEDIATTTATSTAATTAAPTVFTAPTQAVALTRFADAVVANRDVRILRDTDGRSLVLYGYADKRTLLIARDEAAFEALLARLKAE